MSDAGDQLAHSGHFFRMNEFGLQRGGIGDVAHDNDQTDNVALLVSHGTEVHGKLPYIAVAAQYL